MGTSGKHRLKVLISAYACEPGKGSEPAVGWNIAKQMARYHDIWVITRANNRYSVQEELSRDPVSNLHFIYYDLPPWMGWWKRGAKGVRLYYYLWQIGIFSKVRALQKQVGYDLIHHVTLVKYWVPSFLSHLSVPFLWGPVGGGESSPKSFWCQFNLRARAYESARELARRLAEFDPFVRITAKRSVLCLATTGETAERLIDIGAANVKVFSQCGLSSLEIKHLNSFTVPVTGTIKFVSIGRLLHWKGFHLGLRAFVRAQVTNGEYWIIGDGPERASLHQLAISLGIQQRVTFWGALRRNEAWVKLADSHVLVHPSLHDSGGFVCLEAMAARRPVICLDTGGPATCITNETGFKIPVSDPESVIQQMSKVMEQLGTDPLLRERLGASAQDLVASQYLWEQRAAQLNGFYSEITAKNGAGKTGNKTLWP